MSPLKPGEGIIYPGTGVTGGCQSHSKGAGKRTQVLCKSVLPCRAVLPAPPQLRSAGCRLSKANDSLSLSFILPECHKVSPFKTTEDTPVCNTACPWLRPHLRWRNLDLGKHRSRAGNLNRLLGQQQVWPPVPILVPAPRKTESTGQGSLERAL